LNPPEDCAYETLKSELIKRVSSSQEEKTRRLLEYKEIGNHKPFQFLRHLRNPNTLVGDNFLRTIWESRLTRYLQLHLAIRAASSLEHAFIPDAIVDISSNQQPQITQISQSATSNNHTQEDLDSLDAKLNLKLVQLHLQIQNEMIERFTAFQESIEKIAEYNRYS